MGFTKWEWDPHREQNFYHDDEDNTYTYESGEKIAIERPASTAHVAAPSGGGSYRDRTSAGSEFSVASAFSSLSLSEPNSPPPRRGSTIPGNTEHWLSSNHSSIGKTTSERYGSNANAPLSGSTTGDAPLAHSTGYYSTIPTSPQTGNDPSQPYSQSTEPLVAQPNDHERLKQVGRNIEISSAVEVTQPELKAVYPQAQARMLLRGSAHTGFAEPFDPAFQILRPGSSYFRKGFVFKVLWPELAGDSVRNITIVSHGVGKGEKLFVKIRWFVVVREGHNSASCLAIQTYGRKGVTDTKLKSEHAIMYTGDAAPEPLATERPIHYTDPKMGDPIQVIANKKWEKLDVLSRVNFRKIYTVEHNVKVNAFGQVARTDEWKLVAQFNRHWDITPISSIPAQPQPPMPPIQEDTKGGHEYLRGETPRPHAQYRRTEQTDDSGASTSEYSKGEKAPYGAHDPNSIGSEEVDPSRTPVPGGRSADPATAPWPPPRTSSRTASESSSGYALGTTPHYQPGTTSSYHDRRTASSTEPETGQYLASIPSSYRDPRTVLATEPGTNQHPPSVPSYPSPSQTGNDSQGQYSDNPQSRIYYGHLYPSQGYAQYASTAGTFPSNQPQYSPITTGQTPSSAYGQSQYSPQGSAQYPANTYDDTYGATAQAQPSAQTERPYHPGRSTSDTYPQQNYGPRDYNQGRSQSYDQRRP